MVKPNASKNFTPLPLENENHDHACEGFRILAGLLARFHAGKYGQSITPGVKNVEKTKPQTH